MGKHNVPIVERFYGHLWHGDECWLWVGGNTSNKGYPRFRYQGKRYYAYRVMYELLVGPIPEGYDLDHICHNEAAARGECDGGKDCPHHACCRPDHLIPKPRKGNLADSPLTLASINGGKTHCKRNHEFTPENTGLKKGTNWRFCRACSRMTKEERVAWDGAN